MNARLALSLSPNETSAPTLSSVERFQSLSVCLCVVLSLRFHSVCVRLPLPLLLLLLLQCEAWENHSVIADSCSFLHLYTHTHCLLLSMHSAHSTLLSPSSSPLLCSFLDDDSASSSSSNGSNTGAQSLSSSSAHTHRGRSRSREHAECCNSA